MTDRTELLLAEARTQAMREVFPPGADQVRRTVRRRQGIAAGLGVVLAIAAITSGIALVNDRHPATNAPPAAPSSGPSENLDVFPTPDPTAEARISAADDALGDPDKQPWVVATSGVVTADYENAAMDLAADDYQFYLYCVGEGTVDIVLKDGQYGDKKMAAGTATCSDNPEPAILPFTQPAANRSRVFLSGDARAAEKASFSFKIVRTSEIVTEASQESKTNATAAAALLDGSGLPEPAKMTTEQDKTADVTKPAGNYRVTVSCHGPGKVSFLVRTGKTLRDGTVATNGQTEGTVTHECKGDGEFSSFASITLAAGSGLSITAQADSAARNKAGWAYLVIPG
ncbi:hypothetical protein [Winogradskya consettensis]|nr:hypothetical protein [Actinoplanes consettensis]